MTIVINPLDYCQVEVSLLIIILNRKNSCMKYILSLSGLLAATSAFAHEGHGHTHGFTVTHYMVEPEHALLFALMAGVAIYLFSKYRKARSK